MSAPPAVADPDEIADEAAVVAPSRRFSKKLMIIAGAVVAVLIAAGVAAYFLLFTAPEAPHEAEAHEVSAEAYVDVPAMIVNLRSSDGQARLIKLHVLLVPTEEAKSEEIKARLPIVIDRFQPFLRELRPEDLAGSAALYRIKEELLLRANDAVGPGSVSDVLVQDLIQQ